MYLSPFPVSIYPLVLTILSFIRQMVPVIIGNKNSFEQISYVKSIILTVSRIII